MSLNRTNPGSESGRPGARCRWKLMSRKQLSDAEVIERERSAFEADPFGLIKAGYLKIRDKAANLVPFVLNSTQAKLTDLVQARRREGRPVFIVVLKARQLGISTWSPAIRFA